MHRNKLLATAISKDSLIVLETIHQMGHANNKIQSNRHLQNLAKRYKTPIKESFMNHSMRNYSNSSSKPTLLNPNHKSYINNARAFISRSIVTKYSCLKSISELVQQETAQKEQDKFRESRKDKIKCNLINKKQIIGSGSSNESKIKHARWGFSKKLKIDRNVSKIQNQPLSQINKAT
ncbi:hypothetical protein BGT96224_Ac31478 [Blumeria graminis f. sp. tritici 96224]|uniref:Uncharacterized protein n=1 Tax=Blumeria graminis f. sp. tritici 96224 TaxID=1268274 RepID=A0A656KPV2_BLUGR|nr:hypothetical protein BGT96224_Ac31478 [Blumeria graminis f. sp. tritici 96224]